MGMKGGEHMKYITELIKSDPQTDTAMVLTELAKWQDSLDDTVEDSIIYNTLEEVIDIIAEYC